jgi:hypothetical protein
MSTPSTLTELKDAIVARIEALDASAHALIGAADPSAQRWGLSRAPLDAMSASQLGQHLAFSVLISGAPATGNVDHAAETVQIRPRIRIAAVYRLSPQAQDAGHDAAMGAALDVVRGLLGDETWTWGRMNLELVDAFAPGQIVDGTWLEFVVTFDALIDLPYSPAPIRR